MQTTLNPALLICLFTVGFVEAARSQTFSTVPAQASAPEFLSFGELKDLATVAEPKYTLAEKLNAVLTIPFVRNDGSVNKFPPHQPTVEDLGAVVRAASWNIERGLNFDLIESALGNPEQFQREADFENRQSSNTAAIQTQLHALQESDVLILNEVDLGMKRTGYRDVSRDLAAALHMNYAFGVEFVEVDPLFDLGIEKVDLPDKNQEQRLEEDLAVDSEWYRGLHGNAVLSRYPIQSARIVRLPVFYEWYPKRRRPSLNWSKASDGLPANCFVSA
jgi:hypothetical protein